MHSSFDFRFIRVLATLAFVDGFASTASAVPIPADSCPGPFGPQSSVVLDEVVDNGGTFDYGFRVCNTTPDDGGEGGTDFLIRDWELPFFGTDLDTDNEAGIRDIETPTDWFHSLEVIGTPNDATGWDGVANWQNPGDPFFDPRYASHTHVLHFYTGDCFGEEGPADCIFPEDSLAGFGFTANFGPTSAPYRASWFELPPATGDPDFPGAGFPQSQSLLPDGTAPEPGTLSLLLLGAGAFFLRRRD